MPTPFESATLNIKLYDLRREAVMREARTWFVREFNPTTADELISIITGPKNAFFRMVLGYWDMAASMVTHGAIDADTFFAAHGEVMAAFSKVQPYIEQIRARNVSPDFCRHLEEIVMARPNAEAILAKFRAMLLASARQRAAAAVTPNT